MSAVRAHHGNSKAHSRIILPTPICVSIAPGGAFDIVLASICHKIMRGSKGSLTFWCLKLSSALVMDVNLCHS